MFIYPLQHYTTETGLNGRALIVSIADEARVDNRIIDTVPSAPAYPGPSAGSVVHGLIPQLANRFDSAERYGPVGG
jgi:hypothetical protein